MQYLIKQIHVVILQQNLASISEQDHNTENQLEKAQNLLGDSSDFHPPVLWSYDCTLGPRKLKTLKNGMRVGTFSVI